MKILNITGATVFVFLYLLRLHDASNGGGLVAVLLASQAGMAAFLLVFHRRSSRTGTWYQHLQAWTCAFMPFLLRGEDAGFTVWLIIPGLILSVWALVALGRSFSISPDDRGLVKMGPYRLMRHPMYAGELMSFMGLCIGSPSLWNLCITLCISLLLVARIHAEESVLSGYEAYKARVRWRLLPYVW